MIIEYNREALIELYDRNERQKERLHNIGVRIELIKEGLNRQKQMLQAMPQSGFKEKLRKKIYEYLLPYMEEQTNLLQCMQDNMELLYGMEEEQIAERESTLNWLKFNDASVARYHALQERRDRIQNSKKRVVQVCVSLRYGDAVSNDVITIQRALDESGLPNAIYAHSIHERLPLDSAFYIDELPQLHEEDLIIYHASTEDSFMNRIEGLRCRKIIRYHNITPPRFFESYDKTIALMCARGLEQVRKLSCTFDYALAVSEYNKKDLMDMGYTAEIDVVPILLPFQDYAQLPDPDIMSQYNDDFINIVFVGRIAPNKCIEDIIRCFHAYRTSYRKNARLFLAGRYDEGKYYDELLELIREMNIQNVIFTGHTSFPSILAYYHLADVFLCMSEHEGFCVPLLEAMYFEVPIVAYESTAIPYTLGDAGVLLTSKEPDYVAARLNKLLEDTELQKKYIQKGKDRLKNYEYATIKEQILNCLKKMDVYSEKEGNV